MAFAAGTLSKVTGHANYTLGNFWEYKEAETLANIVASGYFNSATNLLQNGDVILVRGSDTTGLRRVSSATAAATVTVATLG